MLSSEMKRLPSFISAPKDFAAASKKCWFLIPRRSVFLLCVLGGDAWLLKLAAAPVVHHRWKKQTKLRLIDQRASTASLSTARTLLRPAVHCFHKFFDFSYERAPICCRCPVSIFRRVCVCVSCTFRLSAPSAVQCASRDAVGDHSGDGTGRHCFHAAFSSGRTPFCKGSHLCNLLWKVALKPTLISTF